MSRRRAGVVVAVLIAARLFAGIATTGAVKAQTGVTVQVQAPAVARTGEEAVITATFRSETAQAALLDVEVRLPNGARVAQRFEDGHSLAPETPVTLRLAWSVPPAAERGVYLISTGVFAPGWGELRHWQDVAAELVVAAPGEPPVPLPSGPVFPFLTLPPGTSLPDGATCAAAVRRNTWEPRPENTLPNHTTPDQLALDPWYDLAPAALEDIFPRIDGAFTGTTDEILQWGACKWGFDLDTVRAVAAGESSWRQDFVGDEGHTFGILQVKASVHGGTHPWSALSTALNVDYALAWRRACFEGDFHWVPDEAHGDEWGCIGLWYTGDWHSPAAEQYIARIRRYLDERAWLAYGF